MNLPWIDSVKDAVNNNSEVRAQQARTIAGIREMIQPELDSAVQLMTSKLQAREILRMPRPGEHRSR